MQAAIKSADKEKCFPEVSNKPEFPSTRQEAGNSHRMKPIDEFTTEENCHLGCDSSDLEDHC